MLLVSANVNGIRAAVRRGGIEWLAEQDADVISLQEVRATDEQLTEALAGTALADYSVAHSPSASLGRSGVAILTKEQPVAIRVGLGHNEFDEQGRWIEVDLGKGSERLTIASAYVHTGELDTPRQVEKYAFLDEVTARMEVLGKRAASGKGHGIITGDLNVAHREVDIKNWKGNVKKAGFLPDERAYFDRWLGDMKWTDLGRTFGGDGPGPYTWWSWRGKAFDNDSGWRIDYVLTTPKLAAAAESFTVGRADTYDQRWSDHAPVVAAFGSLA